MGSPADLSLDCKPHSCYSMVVKSSFGDQTDQTQKLEDFLACLEEERLKIDAFKRELPLCMQLLTDAMEAYRQQLQTFRTNQGQRPILEEFIPIKNSSSEGSDKVSNVSEKASWMTTAQLWSQSNDGNKQQGEIDHGLVMSPKLALDNKGRNGGGGGGGGAFLPFSKDRNVTCTTTTTTTSPTPLRVLPELALATTEKEMEDKKCSEPDNGLSCSSRRENPSKGGGGNGATTTEQGKGATTTTTANPSEGQATNTTQTHRKARRCWSPELHRRFVNALQMLGGSQVATPKQIRELMKVDGLTNDEVKSHLQKYRLHTRRPSPSPQAAGAPAPQLVVLGGIWVPPEYATAAAAAHGAGQAIYGAHPAVSHASTHYCAPAVPQDFYPPQPPPHAQLHHHTLQPYQHIYKASSQTHSSPESEGRPAGDGSESIEDGKSESSSWNKGDSGDQNGGGGGGERERERERERKGLASLRDDGEESNGSEITLKF
ncbi:myb family transcription factor EFM-like isoform X3 [Telopea speciosissima]|uniref:myb family transcription factor EFM-like isoform X3 n=1 Tax=Telopea speciosissima TaxID=54955 RepID=UPI001CC639F5|nr:myb family transcription factor EFM-like isoform X3 [Telopea speciosissima]